MASNEVVLQDFSVNFTPTKITINNENGLKQELESIADKYSGLIVTENNLKSVKSTRAKLNALNKGLDDKRKEIKSNYNAPFNEFEDKVKGYQAIINKSLEPISDGIKTLENSQREERKAHVQEVINEMAPEYDINPTEIEIEKSWTNKTMTDIKLTRILSDGFNALKRKKDLFETNKKLVEEHCKYVGVEPAGWVIQLNDEYNATDVIKAIDQYAENKKQRELNEQKRKESEKAIQEARQSKIGDSVIDTETGEVIQDDIPTEYAVSIQLIGSKVDIIQAIQKINGLPNITSKVLNPLSAWEG